MTHHWDEFTKSLAEESVPRRESLRRLGAVFAGALLGSVGIKPAWAAPKIDQCKVFCKCSNKSQQSQCLAECRDCNSDPRFLCGNCSEGYVCADLANDPWNCGACFNECGGAGPYEYAACNNGRCEYHCESGAIRCNGTCTNLTRDPDNCGACGNVCGAGTTCQNSTCQQNNCVPNCPTNWCGGDGCGGECGCPANSICMGDGLNMCVCLDGLTDCDGFCTDLQWDAQNCGACGQVCGGANPYCSAGRCTGCAGAGGAICNGRCIDTWWDSNNCGGCGYVCPDAGYGNSYCAEGVCYDCTPDYPGYPNC